MIIKHVKQKMVGLLMILSAMILADVFIQNEAGLIPVCYASMGLYYLLTKRQLYEHDYTFRGDKLGL